jgi:hypothetical protein
MTLSQRSQPMQFGPRRTRKVFDNIYYLNNPRFAYFINKIAVPAPELAGVSAASGTVPDALEKAEPNRSVRDWTNKLKGVLHKQSAQVRRLIRERDALEDDDVRRAVEAGVGSVKPSSRLAVVDTELEQAIAARSATANEIESLYHSGSSGSDEDEIPALTPAPKPVSLLF